MTGLVVRLILLAIGVVTMAAGAAAQQPELDGRGRGPIAETAERISRELWPIDGARQPVFRSGIEVDYFRLQVPWIETEGEQSPDARPRGGSYYHQQYLQDVTPVAFRGSTLYPAGVGVDPVVFADGIKAVWRGWQERRIRSRIAAELAALERARAAAGYPESR
jgi:hypothetical protein